MVNIILLHMSRFFVKLASSPAAALLLLLLVFVQKYTAVARRRLDAFRLTLARWRII